MGSLSFGYKGSQYSFNSERVRHAIQDRVIHGLIKDGGFENQSGNWNGYYQCRTSNTFTTW